MGPHNLEETYWSQKLLPVSYMTKKGGFTMTIGTHKSIFSTLNNKYRLMENLFFEDLSYFSNKTILWFYRVSPIKSETTRSRGSWVMIGQTNRNYYFTYMDALNRYCLILFLTNLSDEKTGIGE